MLHRVEVSSVLDLCSVLEASRVSGTWERYQYKQGSLDNEAWGGKYGTLDETIHSARTLEGLEGEITVLENLIQTLEGTVPPPASIRRIPTWGRSGHSVCVARVMAGNLQTAWRRTSQAARPTHGKLLTMVLHGAFSAGCTTPQIRYTTAASLALAALAERAGYRCALWWITCVTGTHGSDDTCVAIPLKHTEQPWTIQDVVITMQGGFLRRMIFRLYEIGTSKGWGEVSDGYGRKPPDERARIDAWAHLHDMQGVWHGADQQDTITSASHAQGWLHQQIAQFAH